MDHCRAEGTYAASLLRVVCDRSVQPEADLGQNFLVDWDVIRDEVDRADLTGDERVLEIGPGMGTLTAALAEEAGSVVAVEKDDRFGPILSELTDEYDDVEVLYGDVLDYNLGQLDFDAVVANLPYGVSLPILFELLETEFEVAVLMIQRDLAERITRSPGESGYNRLSVQFFRVADVRLVRRVDAGAFYPPPDVESALVRIEPTEPKFEVPSEEFFREVLMFLFSQRESTVRDALDRLPGVRSNAAISGADVSGLEDAVGEVATQRVEAVTGHEFGAVTRYLWNRVGGGIVDDFEAFYEREGLYERARE